MGLFTHRYRYIILAVGFLCLVSLSSNPMAYNIAIICMKKDPSSNVTLDDGVSASVDVIVGFRPSVAGTFLGTLPASFLYIYFGARWTFFVSGLISALATAAIPIVVYWNFWIFIVARFFQGLGYSADFAATGILLVRWSSTKQYAVFIGVLTSFTPVSTVITNAACDVGSWQLIWYGHAAFCIVFFALWLYVYTDDPGKTPRVSAVELEKIQRGKTKEHIERDSFVPYWEIIKNPVVLVTWLNAFSELLGVVALGTYLPAYFAHVLGFSTATTGLATALSQAGHLPVKMCVAFLSDKIKRISEVYKMMFFNTWAVGVCGLVAVAFAFIPASQAVLSVIVISLYLVVAGAACAGYYKCATIVCRQYSHFVMSNIQFTKCISLFVAPGMKALFVGEEETVWWRWRNMWLTLGVLNIVVNFVFYFVCTDQPAEFTRITRSNWEHYKKTKTFIEDETPGEKTSNSTAEITNYSL